MRKTILSLGMILALLIASVPGALAQVSGPYPAIISFTSDVNEIALADVEAGDTEIHLSWQVVGMSDQHRVMLYVDKFNQWQSPLAADAPPLPATGRATVIVTHPLNFGPPTYNLMVLDAAGQVLDQRFLIIPYANTTGDPEIAEFSAGVQALDVNTVADGSARIAVSWNVANRAPNTNLVFEQLLDSDLAVSVELPRPNRWIPSQGEGVVAPVMPGSGAATKQVRLRLRVIDMVDGSTLAEQTLSPITLTGTVAPVPTQAPAEVLPPSSDSAAQITSFTVEPTSIEPGGTVTVRWDVANTAQLGVWLLDTAGRLSISGPATMPRGSWTLTIPDGYTTNARFMIFASDAQGRQRQATQTVQIACPYTYFFPTTGPVDCPASPPISVQGAFQTFERGNMIWRSDTGEIFVLYADARVGVFRDYWMGEILNYPADTPPAGLYPPGRGFGRVWVDNADVRAGLGWGITFEQYYTMTVQSSGDAQSRLYMTWPDGTVIYMDYGTWGYK